VQEKLPSMADTADIGNILKTSGTILISSVGGASGPLYGTFFMRGGMAVQHRQELEDEDVVNFLTAGMEGVVQRGRAAIGDKTMVDALSPAIETLKSALAEGKTTGEALQACAAAAEQGVQDTVPLIAKKGRASYLGERSQGHPDPGATSTYYLLKTLSDVVNE
ncbi:MAG: dihydroxyacetone kinase subunit DhaL, partial [Chloroflexota bacterium]